MYYKYLRIFIHGYSYKFFFINELNPFNGGYGLYSYVTFLSKLFLYKPNVYIKKSEKMHS